MVSYYVHFESKGQSYLLHSYTEITVKFDNTAYTVNESVGIVQPLLVLSNPSSFVEIVEIQDSNFQNPFLGTYVC